MLGKTRVLIVDDHALIIKGIVASLNEIGGFDVITTDNCDDAFFLIKTHHKENPFQIIFTDLSFSNTKGNSNLTGGEELIKEIIASEIKIHIAVLTGHTETNRIFNIIHNYNPNAYILKTKCTTDELRFAIEKMMSNDYYYTHEVHQKIMKRRVIEIKMDDIGIQILKELPNQTKISNLEGLIVRADGSAIKLRSIETKLAKLREDLEANNNTDLVLKAKELGIID